MARGHLLEGLMKWATREPWRDRFEAVLEDHVLPTCDETGIEADEIVSILGEDLFMSGLGQRLRGHDDARVRRRQQHRRRLSEAPRMEGNRIRSRLSDRFARLG